MWIHVIDQNGYHTIFNISLGIYFRSGAVDGSQAISMSVPSMGFEWFVSPAEFTAIVGALPTAYPVTLP
jgi:hypothetical protein